MSDPASSKAHLFRQLALTAAFPLMAAQAQSVWDPIVLPKSEQLRWQRVPTAQAESSVIVWAPISDDEATLIAAPPAAQQKPISLAEAERLLDPIEPTINNYWPLLRLGSALPKQIAPEKMLTSQMTMKCP